MGIVAGNQDKHPNPRLAESATTKSIQGRLVSLVGEEPNNPVGTLRPDHQRLDGYERSTYRQNRGPGMNSIVFTASVALIM